MKKIKKVYVITGSTSGIGYELLKRLSNDNIVFAGYRSEDKIKNWNFSENVIPFYIDMSESSSIKEASEYIKSKTNKINTLINVAGCVVAGAVEEINIKDIKYQFDVNTFSHLEFTQYLLPLLNESRVINVSSMASYGIFPFIAPYCASKRALDILFNSMQLECDNKFKYISVKPGAIATPLWRKSVDINAKTLSSDKYKKEYDYLIDNAYKNEKNGLSVSKVADIILKADCVKNPKTSYIVGRDAFFANFISYIPQDMLNKLIKIGMKIKIKGYSHDKQRFM